MERQEIEDFFLMLASDGFYEHTREHSLALASAFQTVREYFSALVDAWEIFEQMEIVLSHHAKFRIGRAAILEWEKQ